VERHSIFVQSISRLSVKLVMVIWVMFSKGKDLQIPMNVIASTVFQSSLSKRNPMLNLSKPKLSRMTTIWFSKMNAKHTKEKFHQFFITIISSFDRVMIDSRWEFFFSQILSWSLLAARFNLVYFVQHCFVVQIFPIFFVCVFSGQFCFCLIQPKPNHTKIPK
jgi:hypothetical protein